MCLAAWSGAVAGDRPDTSRGGSVALEASGQWKFADRISRMKAAGTPDVATQLYVTWFRAYYVMPHFIHTLFIHICVCGMKPLVYGGLIGLLKESD